MTHKEIIGKLHDEFNLVDKTTSLFIEENFFKELEAGKWSAAQNEYHLFLSVKPLVGLFSKPEVMLTNWGKCTRASMSYKELVALYEKMIRNIIVPASVNPASVEGTKTDVINNLNAINQKFVEKAAAFTEEELDTYQIPHPVMGLLTVREFLYFTLHHTQHHHATIKRLLAS